VSKRIALLLITMLAVSSLIMAESAYAQSIPEPSVPEFTVKIVAYPYDVPTTHSIDPFTGQDVTHEGYHVNNQSIEVRIKNQPFTPTRYKTQTVTAGLSICSITFGLEGTFQEIGLSFAVLQMGIHISGLTQTILSYRMFWEKGMLILCLGQ
jgi:hypothetical protein